MRVALRHAGPAECQEERGDDGKVCPGRGPLLGKVVPPPDKSSLRHGHVQGVWPPIQLGNLPVMYMYDEKE